MKSQEISVLSQSNPLPSTEGNNAPLNHKQKSSRNNRNLSWQVADNLWVSFQYAMEGLNYAFVTQRNFRLHTLLGSLVITLSIFLRLSPVEIAIIGLTIGAVVATELLNTAIESVVDLAVGQSYHEMAKIAKDCAAAAVLVSAVISIFVGLILILPPMIKLILSLLLI